MSWLDILKISDDAWERLTEGVLNDTLPKNRQQYVRFSNLDDINKRMVKYYLKKGLAGNNKVKEKCLKGILDEMARSSNQRYDIQDRGGQ